MTIIREDEKWSPCLDNDRFQFSGLHGKDGDSWEGTWFFSRDSSGASSLFENLSVILEYLTFLKRK